MNENISKLNHAKDLLRRFIEVESEFLLSLEKRVATPNIEGKDLTIRLSNIVEQNIKVLKVILLELDTIKLLHGESK
jgi:hypothetical protein